MLSTCTTARPLGPSLTGVSALKVGLASRLGSDIPLPLQVRYFAGGDSTFRGFPQDRLGNPHDFGFHSYRHCYL